MPYPRPAVTGYNAGGMTPRQRVPLTTRASLAAPFGLNERDAGLMRLIAMMRDKQQQSELPPDMIPGLRQSEQALSNQFQRSGNAAAYDALDWRLKRQGLMGQDEEGYVI